MERVLEPELMDDPAQADAYAGADFAAVNEGFAERLSRLSGATELRHAVDLGCGPADIPLRIARRLPSMRIVAVDAAAPMLSRAARAVRDSGLAPRLSLVRARLPDLPFAPGQFDAVISNSLLHHLADPKPFWSEILRLARPGAWVLVMDLFRPDSPAAAHKIVAESAGREDPLLQRDFHRSLLAAFTPEEVRAQLPRPLASFGCTVVSERHWIVCGRLSEQGDIP